MFEKKRADELESGDWVWRPNGARFRVDYTAVNHDLGTATVFGNAGERVYCRPESLFDVRKES